MTTTQIPTAGYRGGRKTAERSAPGCNASVPTILTETLKPCVHAVVASSYRKGNVFLDVAWFPARAIRRAWKATGESPKMRNELHAWLKREVGFWRASC